ncbi:hypothetical protein K501DRAFT_336344 [Backusella circina FSU 941]|nr:hypothetical protein K501DRAFT_336344 [Backusella circina FSU 941]
MKKNGDAATADNDAMEDNNNNTTKNKKKVTMLKVTGGPHPGFRGIIEKEPEYCTVSENNTGFSNWTMPEEERGPSQSQDDKSMYIIGHTKIITASILDVARNIAKGIPHIEEPLLILRESFERFHGGFDPFYIQLLRSQLKMVFSKDNSTIIFDSFAYKCVIDTFSDMYDEFDPAIVDKIDFESDGFVFNLEYIHAFLKEIFPVHAELTKKMQTSIEMKNMFDFTFDDGAFTIHVENFAYYKVDGFPLYNDKGEVLISATDISCHLTLSILNNEVRVEYCKCKIGTLNVQFYESTKTSLVNLLVKQTLKKIMRRKLQESLEQVLTITFTNIFL